MPGYAFANLQRGAIEMHNVREVAQRAADRACRKDALALSYAICPKSFSTGMTPMLQSAMRHALKLHPESACGAIERIEVEVVRPTAAAVVIDFLVSGDIARLSFPNRSAAHRSDELWKHTCFEAFLREATAPAYVEFNFSPSFQWQAYTFRAYREGMDAPDEIPKPQFCASVDARVYKLNVSLSLAGVSRLSPGTPWKLALSAVIEEMNEQKSYWALAHPPGKPDFHHMDGFALELPAGIHNAT